MEVKKKYFDVENMCGVRQWLHIYVQCTHPEKSLNTLLETWRVFRIKGGGKDTPAIFRVKFTFELFLRPKKVIKIITPMGSNILI